MNATCPNTVELANQPVRRGDTVPIRPPRSTVGPTDPTLWTVERIDRKAGGSAVVTLVETKPAEGDEPEIRDRVKIDDLVVVAQRNARSAPGSSRSMRSRTLVDSRQSKTRKPKTSSLLRELLQKLELGYQSSRRLIDASFALNSADPASIIRCCICLLRSFWRAIRRRFSSIYAEKEP